MLNIFSFQIYNFITFCSILEWDRNIFALMIMEITRSIMVIMWHSGNNGFGILVPPASLMIARGF